MSNATRNLEDVLPVPWDLLEMIPYSLDYLSNYLLDAFEASFGLRPIEIVYASFPGDDFAGVLVEGRPTLDHSVWALQVSSRLRSVGIEITVVPRAASDFYPKDQTSLTERAPARGQQDVCGHVLPPTRGIRRFI